MESTKKLMRILYLVNSGQPGGVEQYILDLVKGLGSGDNKVFTWCAQGPIVRWYKDAGATVSVKKINFDIDPFYIIDLVTFLKTNKIDVVHANELKVGINAMIATKLAKTKCCVTHVHTPISQWKTTGSFRNLFTKVENFVYSVFVNLLSDTEIALTQTIKQVKFSEGIRKEKLIVIPNGLDHSKFEFSQDVKNRYRAEILNRYKIPIDSVVIGNIGRMTQEKGHQILLEAFSKLKASKNIGSNVKLLLAGGGQLEEKYRNFVKENRLEKEIFITGVFENEDNIKMYASLDIFIFPSEAEGFGIVLLEGMLSGVPVISSDLEVLKEVGCNEVVYFITGDSDSLADAILRILSLNRGRRSEVAKKLGTHVRNNYGMEKFVESYKKLYEGIILRA